MNPHAQSVPLVDGTASAIPVSPQTDAAFAGSPMDIQGLQHASAASSQHASAAQQHVSADPVQHASAVPVQHVSAAPMQHASADPVQHASADPSLGRVTLHASGVPGNPTPLPLTQAAPQVLGPGGGYGPLGNIPISAPGGP